MMDDYIKALIDMRDLIYELERSSQAKCEKTNFRDDMIHGIYIGYSSTMHIINALIRERGAEKVQ